MDEDGKTANSTTLPALQIHLLGAPEVLLNAEPVTNFVSRKSQALFFYLAVTGHVHMRARLADFFWPFEDEKRGRKNVRDVVRNLRAMLGDYLDISYSQVAMGADKPYWVDVKALETAVASPTMADLLPAVTHYRGDFLDGFSVDDAPEFDNWVVLQTERLRQLAIQGLYWLSEEAVKRLDIPMGLQVTEKLLEMEPWHEDACYKRMLLFAYDGHLEAAVQTYRNSRTMLKQMFDIAPGAKTENLYQRLLSEMGDNNQLYGNLPHELTPFFGREHTLPAIRQKIVDPVYPLLTITGEGGVGKTRLALQLAEQVRYEFEHGLWFVSLGHITAAESVEQVEEEIATAVASAVNLPLSGKESVSRQVVNYLKPRCLLLVLDSFEHVLNGHGFIQSVLQEAEAVTFLVTSRIRLRFQSEWVYRLEGMAVPTAKMNLTQMRQMSSIKLFSERAQRTTGRPFALTDKNAPAVVQICDSVGGLPLGLELAAALTEEHTVVEIAGQIAPQTLTADFYDTPERHSSISAVLEYSWQLLSEHNQHILAQCSVFQGGFMLAAATAVAHASETDLTNLVNQSLLTQDSNGRYAFHPLIHQFCQQKFTAYETEVATAVAKRHYTYYLQWAQSNKDTLVFLPHPDLQIEWSNIRRAWQAITDAREFSLIAEVVEGFVFYIENFPFNQSWADMLSQTIQQFEQSMDSSPEAQEILARLLIGYGFMLNYQSLFKEMLPLADKLLSLTTTPTLVGYGYYLKSRALRELRESDEAREFLHRTVEQTTELPPAIYLDVYVGLGQTHIRQGDITGATKWYEQALQVAVDIGFKRGMMIVSDNLGALSYMQKDYYRATFHYQNALTYTDSPLNATINMLSMSYAHLGKYREAEQYAQQSMAYSEPASPMRKANNALSHAFVFVHCQQYREGQKWAEIAQEIFQSIGKEQHLVFVWLILGKAHLGLKNWSQAKDLFTNSYNFWDKVGIPSGTLDSAAGLAQVALIQKDLASIRKWGAYLAQTLPKASIYHEAVDNWPWVYLTCYQALTAVNDPRAPQILQAGYDLLQKHANMIEDEALRQSYLQNVPANRKIMRLARPSKTT